MGERRWDVVLDRDQRLMLPEVNPVRALDRTLALDSAEDLLARDFTHLDLRNPERPTLRLSARALDEFRQITAEVTKVTQ
jgi:cell division protein FtsQ